MKINQGVKQPLIDWYKKFRELSTEPMDEFTSVTFLKCTTDEKKELTPELKKAHIVRILLNSAEIYGFTLTPGLTVMLFLLSDGKPAQVVMLLSALMYYKQTESMNTDYRITDLVRICPWGFPSKEFYKVLWDLQKQPRVRDSENMFGSDNMLNEAFID